MYNPQKRFIQRWQSTCLHNIRIFYLNFSEQLLLRMPNNNDFQNVAIETVIWTEECFKVFLKHLHLPKWHNLDKNLFCILLFYYYVVAILFLFFLYFFNFLSIALTYFRLIDHLQISLLVWSEFKRISKLLFPLKLPKNHRFSDDFRGNRN